jgi:hypothetical protein
MERALPVLVVIAAAALGLLAPPALATAVQSVYFRDDWTPAATVAHPATRQAAMVITEKMDLVACDFWYAHDRWPLDFSGNHPDLSDSGEMTVTMERVRGRRTKKIGRQVVDAPDLAAVGWADSPVICARCVEYDFTFETSTKFPLRVKPGDVLLWTVSFSGMPDVEIDREGDPGYFDTLAFLGTCSTCGSIDHPCVPSWRDPWPDPWS